MIGPARAVGPRPGPASGGPAPSRPAGVVVVVLVALPWLWFAVRESSGLVGDVLAIVAPLLAVLLAAAALRTARRAVRMVLPAISVLLMGAVAVLEPWVPADAGAVAPGASVTIAAANVQALPSALAPLLALAPDVIAVAEMAPRLEPELAAAYPYRHVAYVGPPEGGPDVAVYSRWPLRVLEEPGPDLPGIRAEVDGPGGPFVLYALHVARPWFTTTGSYQATVAEHHQIMEGVAARVAAETLPAVVVGDLNSPDRGRDYRRLLDRGGLVDAMRHGSAAPTSVAKWAPLLLRIDHLLVSEGWCGDAPGRFDLPGSDHRGIRATVGPCAPRVRGA